MSGILAVAQKLAAQSKIKAGEAAKVNLPVSPPPEFRLTQDEMNKIESEFNNTIKDNDTPDLDYVTASQARIFIGGILVDEAYDVQYNYRETKEPIYGYNSKHWDAVLNGTVIVYGSFTINYKHDAYLYSILSKLSDDSKSYSNNKDTIINDKKNAEAYQSTLREYKKLQGDINDAKQTLKKLKAEVVQAEAELNMANMRNDLDEKDIQTRLDNAIDAKNAFWNSLAPSYQLQLQDKVQEFDDSVKNGLERIQSEGDDRLQYLASKVSAAQQEVDSVTKQITEMESNITMLQDLQKTLNAINSPDEYLKVVQETNKQQNSILELKELSLDPAQEALAEANSNLEKARQEIEYSVQDANSTLASMTTEDPNIAEAKRLDLIIRRIQAEMSSRKAKVSEDKGKLSEKSAKAKVAVSKQEVSISTMEGTLAEMLGKISAAKDLARKNYAAIDALATSETDGEEDRPEDFHKFNILIEYNGKIHKRLEECELVSHSHIVSQSGQPVKEYYQFIAKRLV